MAVACRIIDETAPRSSMSRIYTRWEKSRLWRHGRRASHDSILLPERGRILRRPGSSTALSQKAHDVSGDNKQDAGDTSVRGVPGLPKRKGGAASSFSTTISFCIFARSPFYVIISGTTTATVLGNLSQLTGVGFVSQPNSLATFTTAGFVS